MASEPSGPAETPGHCLSEVVSGCRSAGGRLGVKPSPSLQNSPWPLIFGVPSTAVARVNVSDPLLLCRVYACLLFLSECSVRVLS